MNKTNIKNYRQFLFCPGPVNVVENVKDASTAYEIGHREKEFSLLLKSINKKILEVFEIKNKKAYHPVVITGSGTAANEAMLSSVIGNKHILIISNGEFGERLADISHIHNPNTHHIRFNWGEPFDLDYVKKYIKINGINCVAIVHHETSTGMLNPAKKIGQIAKKDKLLFILDTVSSAGADKIDLEGWNVDFCSSSASKAIGSLAGVSLVIGRNKEFQNLKNIPARTAYLNLYKFYTYSKNYLQTPNTPAVQAFFALEQALANILKEGVIERTQHFKNMTSQLRNGMRRMGCRFLIDEEDMSSVLTTVFVPKGINISVLKDDLRRNHIIVYNGKGPIKDKVFQVGNIGNLKDETISYFLTVLEQAITKQRKEASALRTSLRHAQSSKSAIAV